MTHRRVPAASRGRVAGIPRATLLVALLAACGGGQAAPAGAELRIENAWARPVSLASPAGGTADDAHAAHAGGSNGAVYLTLRNTGREADRLVGAESPAAHLAEVHRSGVEDGIMRMRPADGVPVPAGESVRMEPGGLHIMLIHLNKPLEPGDRFPLRLHFEKSGTQQVEVEVRAP
jgi:copper(I)-binding protein